MDIITLTYCDMAENSVEMQQIGNMVRRGHGFQLSELNHIKELMEKKEAICNLYSLGNEKTADAYVLVIKNGVNIMLSDFGYDEKMLYEEQANLDHDKYKFQRGGVVNSKARYNLCFSNKNQEPDYINKKGRIIAFDNVPITKALRESFLQFGEKSSNLQIEGNYYYDRSICGISFHGDNERRKVIGVRLGDEQSFPLQFQWYLRRKPMFKRIEIPLSSGDIYVMSEKAVGNDGDWPRFYVLKHATGCKINTENPKDFAHADDL